MTKYTIPKICQTNNFWYVYFLFEGKEFRFHLNYNTYEDLEERQIYFEELAKAILKELKKGFDPNEYPNNDNLFLGKFTEIEISRLLFNLDEENKKLKTTPKHPTIFCENGFVLFEYILTNHITENRGRINDISFYYWKMYNDNYIIQKPFPFIEWFMKLYNVDNFQIKTLETTQNPNRLKHYSNSLDWFKLQNQ